MHMATANMNFVWLWSMMVRHIPREMSEKIVLLTLLRNDGRLLTWPRKKIVAWMNIVLMKPTITVVRSFLWKEVMPTFSKL